MSYNSNYNPRFPSNGRLPNRPPNPNHQQQRLPANGPNGRNGHNNQQRHPVPQNQQVQRPHQQYGPRPYQIPAYNSVHMQQGSSTSRRSRRRDVYEISLSGASKRGHGQGQGQKGENKKHKDRNNYHFGPNFGSKGSGGKAGTSKLADNVATSVVTQLCNGLELDQDSGKLIMKNIIPANIEYADLYIGNFRGILNNNEQVASFQKGLKDQKCPTDSLIIPAQSINFPKATFEKTIKNCYLKFSIGWFDDLRMAIYKKVNKKSDDDLLLDGDNVNLNSVKTTDIFDKISEMADQQIKLVLDYYKPTGYIYVIIQSGTICDSIIGAHCLINNYPIIQLDHNTQNPKLIDIKDDNERAYTFGFRIGQIVRLGLKKKGNDKKPKQEIKDDEVFDMSKM